MTLATRPSLSPTAPPGALEVTDPGGAVIGVLRPHEHGWQVHSLGAGVRFTRTARTYPTAEMAARAVRARRAANPDALRDESGLTGVERRMLRLENGEPLLMLPGWPAPRPVPTHGPVKDAAIIEVFNGWRPNLYWQALARLVQRPEAAAYRPLAVARLRRLLATRARARSGANPTWPRA